MRPRFWLRHPTRRGSDRSFYECDLPRNTPTFFRAKSSDGRTVTTDDHSQNYISREKCPTFYCSLSCAFRALFHLAITARLARSLRSSGDNSLDFAALAAVAFAALFRNDSRDTAFRAFSILRRLAAVFFSVLIRPIAAAACDISSPAPVAFLLRSMCTPVVRL